MPDLLAHALVAYSVCLVLSWRYVWIASAYVTVGMAGAFVPDLAKVAIGLPGAFVESVVGLPFDWFALHTAGGVLVSVVIGGLVVVPRERRRVLGLLAVGAASHLLIDALLYNPTGRSYAILWPLTRYHPPTPGWYLSTQPGPMFLALIVSIGVTVVTWSRRGG